MKIRKFNELKSDVYFNTAKKLKELGHNIGKPEVGDYVICDEQGDPAGVNGEIIEFIKNNIGVIIKFDRFLSFPYIIKYDKIPYDIEFLFRYENKAREFKFSEIKYWSKDKEDLEMIIAAKNYNL